MSWGLTEARFVRPRKGVPRSSSSTCRRSGSPVVHVLHLGNGQAAPIPDSGDEPYRVLSTAGSCPPPGKTDRPRGRPSETAEGSSLAKPPTPRFQTDAARRSGHGQNERDRGSNPADQHQRAQRKNDRQLLARILLGADEPASSQQLAIQATDHRRWPGLLDTKWHVVRSPLLERSHAHAKGQGGAGAEPHDNSTGRKYLFTCIARGEDRPWCPGRRASCASSPAPVRATWV